MFERLINYLGSKFINTRIKLQTKEIKRLKSSISDMNNTIARLVNEKSELDFIIYRFQEASENLLINQELNKVYAYSTDSHWTPREGALAYSHGLTKTDLDSDSEIPTFIWRDEVAVIKENEFIFRSSQMDIIDWIDYPRDAIVFIEWIKHHQDIIDGDKKKRPYSVSLY